MKIDLIITELETGGAEKCCFQLAKFLRERSHDARIISIGPYAKPPKDAILNQARNANIPVISLDASSIRRFPRAWSRLRHHLKKDPPQIVQSFMWHANILAATLYPSFHIPLVGGARVLDRTKSRIKAAAWAAHRMHSQVAVSNEVAEWIHESEKIPMDKIITIPNGIDLDQWDQKQAPPIDPKDFYNQLPIDTPVLLVVGRMNDQKGTDKLAERLEFLLDALPDHHMVFLGDGPYRHLIEEKRKSPKAGGRIHCLGINNYVKAWMHRSQMLLLPSRYEGMPNVVLEAMASSLPVATLRVEGVTDLLGNSVLETQISPKNDWDDWAKNVIAIANNPQLHERLSKGNRQQVESKFQLHNVLKQYETLYKNILK